MSPSVLHLHQSLAPSGGAETFLLALDRHLRVAGVPSAVLELDGLPPAAVLRRARRADLLVLHVVYYRVHPLFVLLLSRLRPTVMYMHDTVHFCFTLEKTLPDGSLCLRGTGPWCLGRCRLRERVRFLRTLPLHGLKRWAYRRLPRIVCPSRFTRDELLGLGFRPWCLVRLPLFLPLPPAWRRVPAGGERDLVLFVGRPSRGKGFEVLCQALAEVSVPFRAVALGGRERRRLVFPRGELRLLPALPREELGPWYARARVLALPSLAPESFGLVGLEAMHFGVPVVATRPGGAEDWLVHGETGLLVPRGHPRALARAVEALLTDRGLWEEMSARARQQAARFLDPAPHLRLLTEAFGPAHGSA